MIELLLLMLATGAITLTDGPPGSAEEQYRALIRECEAATEAYFARAPGQNFLLSGGSTARHCTPPRAAGRH